MKLFYRFLINTLIASTTNSTVWFAITFFAYLETQSVMATALLAGLSLVAHAGTGVWFGSVVDRFNKKQVMMYSSLVSLLFYGAAAAVYGMAPVGAFASITSPVLWGLVLLLLGGCNGWKLTGYCHANAGYNIGST